jgi:hypothetical protein
MPVPIWLTPDAGIDWVMPNSPVRPVMRQALVWNGAWKTLITTPDTSALEDALIGSGGGYRWLWLYFPGGYGLPYQAGWWGGMLPPGYELADFYKVAQNYGS